MTFQRSQCRHAINGTTIQQGKTQLFSQGVTKCSFPCSAWTINGDNYPHHLYPFTFQKPIYYRHK
nr:MAG TPA: hypothetical protein [Caudoviricetes sp.]